jgi:glycosyltransferase involved in cell wall biosynthesis
VEAGSNNRLQLSLVLPLRNEEEILWTTVDALAKELDAEVGEGCWQLIPVDNGSSDTTPEIIDRVKGCWPATLPIRLKQPNIGAAMRAGLRAAQGEWAFIMPIDEGDPAFFRWSWRSREHYDLIIGSKRLNPVLNGQTPYRRFLTWGLNALLNGLTEYIGSDTHGCKLVRLSALLPVDQRCVMSRGQYDTEMTIRAVRSGLRVAELPVVYTEKRAPRDFMLKKIGRNVVDLVRLYRALKSEPFQADVRFHRWSRYDVETLILPCRGPLEPSRTASQSSSTLEKNLASLDRKTTAPA